MFRCRRVITVFLGPARHLHQRVLQYFLHGMHRYKTDRALYHIIELARSGSFVAGIMTVLMPFL